MTTQNQLSKLSRFGFFAMTASLFITVYEYPTFAESGKTLIFFLLLCGLFWFLPVALSAAELATIKGYQEGGIFSWVGKPLGQKYGFAAIFFQWFQITVGFVTMIYFIIGTLADVFSIHAINTVPVFKFGMVVLIFWVLTFFQLKGTKATEKLAKYGFSIGIVLPVLVMLGLAIKYFLDGHQVSTSFTNSSFLPTSTSVAALTSFVLAYMGVEASAPHITELENPQRNYPMIMLVLVVVGVVLSTIGGSVVAMVLHGTISSNGGVVDAFRALISPGQNTWLVVVLGCLISFGVMAQVGSWIVSPTEGLRFVASKGLLPAKYKKVNKANVPVPLLVLQGVIVTIWAAVLTFGSGSSGANISFQTAISLTVLIYLSAYILFFVAYFVVVYKQKDLEREYQVPGGTIGKTVVATIGLVMSLAAIVTAFIIPSSMNESEGHTYITMLALSFVTTIALPFVFYRFYSSKHTIE